MSVQHTVFAQKFACIRNEYCNIPFTLFRRFFAELQLEWMHCYLRTHLARSKAADSVEDSLGMFFGCLALKEIRKFDNSEEFVVRKDLLLEQQTLHSSFTRFLVDSLLASEVKAQRGGGGGKVESSSYFKRLLADDKKRAHLSNYLNLEDVSDLQQAC